MTLNVVSRSRCFGGTQYTYQHRSSETGTMMRLAAFVPSQAHQSPVPVVWYLSGLTCTEENFTVKAAAQRIAAELGLLTAAACVSDTSNESPISPKATTNALKTRVLMPISSPCCGLVTGRASARNIQLSSPPFGASRGGS